MSEYTIKTFKDAGEGKEPEVTVTIERFEEALQVLLGVGKPPYLHIERVDNGWQFFVHPHHDGDAACTVKIGDDAHTTVEVEDAHYGGTTVYPHSDNDRPSEIALLRRLLKWYDNDENDDALDSIIGEARRLQD